MKIGEFPLALVTCPECGKQISDQGSQCIGCGAPMTSKAEFTKLPAVTNISFDARDELFIGTVSLLVKLAAKCINELSWRVDNIDETNGLVSFTTGMTWGSFSGVSGTLLLEEVKPSKFKVTGSAKQNLRGGQVVALNLFNESQKKVDKIVASMQSKVPNTPYLYDPNERN